MGEFLPVLILLLIISSISKASKAAKKNAAQAQKQAKPAQAKPAQAGKPRSIHFDPPVLPESKPAKPRPAQPAKPLGGGHHAQPLEAHMHTPVMGEEGVGTEGIDCCHDYMLGDAPAAPEAADFLPLQEDNQQERAQALLQGVIFSEILGRRPIRRYGGRQA